MSQPTPAQVRELWKQGKLGYKLHEGQKPIRATIRALPREVREALVFCSRRYGKSFLACIMAIEDCLKKPNSQVFIVGPTIKQTTGIVNGIMPMIMQDAPDGLLWQAKSEKQWHMANGSRLILGGFDSALESFRGLFADAIYLEESGLAHPDTYEYTLKSVLFPTLMHSRGRITHLTTPATIIDHPLHLDTIPKTIASGAYFKFTIRDNPLLTEEQIAEEIENLGGLSSSHCQRELFCDIVRDEQTTVVPQFDERRHVAPIIVPSDAYHWVSGDIGGVRDKSVIHLCAYDHNTKKICFLDERAFDPKTPTNEIVKSALEMEEGRKVYRAVDAPGQLYVDLSSVYNYPCFLPEKLHFDQNIHRVQTAFHKDEVLVDPKCRLLIATLNSGQLNKQRTDFARTESLGHCDALASLVYGLRHADRRVPLEVRKPTENVWNRQPKPAEALVHQLRKIKG